MVKLEFLSNLWRKKTLLFGIIIILVLLIGASYIFNLSSSKKKITPFVTYPSKGEYIHGQVIVAFRGGYIPKQIEKEIGDGKNKDFLGRLKLTLKNEKTSEEKLSLIKKNLSEIGVTDYKPEFEGDAEKLNKFYILFYDSNIPIEKIQNSLKDLQFLESSEPNSMLGVFASPNDPYYSQLWGIQKIQASQAWDITKGSASIIVADIDTGVDLSHPDLSINLVSGWNFVNNTNNPQDDMGHGTHVAGTIGAVGNNGTGVVGVNWNVKIMPIKVMGADGSGSSSIINQGIKYAADHGARVANLSLGGPGVCGSSQQSVINYAIGKGVVIVVAAGNGDKYGNGIDAANDQPGNCNGVITVGATTSTDSRTRFSNYGSTVEIAAPGSGILSTVPVSSVPLKNKSTCPSTLINGQYCSISGTSMATPHVAGAAALLLSANPNLSPAEVSKCLIDNADSISTDRPIGPRLNIFKAISACSGGPMPTLPSGVTPTLTPVPTITNAPSTYSISINVFVDNNQDGRNDAGDTNYQGANIRLSSGSSGTTDASGNISFPNLLPGSYTLTFTVSGYNVAPYTVNITNGNFSLSLPLPPIASLTPPIVVTRAPTPTPTLTPVPTSGGGGGGGVLTPTPIPQTTYNCVIDQTNCPQGQKNLQLCPLKCTPI